jgi:outer membrane protein assembly factor BamB
MRRRRFLAAVGLAATVGCSALPAFGDRSPDSSADENRLSDAGACPSRDGWRSSRGDAQNTGFAARGPDITDATVERVADRMVEGTAPVADDERVYAAVRGGVRAFDRATGDSAWERSLDGGAARSPLVTCHAVFAQTPNYLSALDPETGERIWRTALGHGAPDPNLVATRDAVVLAGTPGVTQLSHGGSVEWRTQVDRTVFHGVAHAGDRVVVTESSDDGGGVYAFDAASGERLWTTRGLPSIAEPVVDDEHAYVVGKDGAVAAFSLADGDEAWRTDARGKSTYAPAALDRDRGLVYVPTGSSGDIAALDTADGAERWRADVGDWADTPVVGAADALYSAGQQLHRIDPDSGRTTRLGVDTAGSGGLAVTESAVWLNDTRSLVRAT